VRAIPAHGRVGYAMRLAVPRRAKFGYAKLGWSLNTPTGPLSAGLSASSQGEKGKRE